MAKQNTESKRLLSYVIAEWACSLKYENLSPEAIQAAKLFWFDSIGCALGGSQQDDAKILLKHYHAMSGCDGKATTFVSGFINWLFPYAEISNKGKDCTLFCHQRNQLGNLEGPITSADQ